MWPQATDTRSPQKPGEAGRASLAPRGSMSFGLLASNSERIHRCVLRHPVSGDVLQQTQETIQEGPI